MVTNQSQRPLFYENQYLSADDLNEVVTYERVQQERHLLGAHTWGIAMGLQLKAQTAANGQVEMYIQPGYGWDGYGRPIVLLAPYKLAPTLFASTVSDGSSTGQQVPVWLRYASSETQGPRPGFAVCEPQDQNSRIQESFQVEVGEQPSLAAQRDGVLLAGRTVDAQSAFQRFDPNDFPVYDASIPFQTFPDDADQKRWLLPLGVVRWQPNANTSLPGTFLQLTDADQQYSLALRTAVGVVAGYVQAVDGRIRMRDRRVQLSNVASDDLVWIEGNLRVDFDINLFHGQLSFFDQQGNDEGTPLAIQRLEDNGRGGKDLLAIIGQFPLGSQPLPKGNNSFAVGTWDANRNPQEVFVVRDDARVGIGTTSPTNQLHVNGNTGIRQNRLYMSGGDGWSSLTYNAYHNDTNSNWVFPDQSHTAVTIEMDDADGVPRFQVYNTTSGASAAWIQRFAIDGNSGNVLMAQNGGNVGIGTPTPLTALQIPERGIQIGVSGTTTDNFYIVSDLNGGARGLRFYNGNYGPGTHLLSVLSSGSVGIGIVSPSRTLHVEGSEIHSGSGGAGFSFGNRQTAGFVEIPSAGERWVWYSSLGTARLWSGNDKLSITSNDGSLSVAGNITIGGNRTYLLGLDPAQTHWIMAGGIQEGWNNAIGLSYYNEILNPNMFHTGPGWVKGFLIDHPLDKERKYLSHATLEGPEVAVIYRGEESLSDGAAMVVLPDYFEALTRKEGRTVLLTPKFEGDALVSTLAASQVTDGRFTVKIIQGENRVQKFYWEVKAVRADVGILSVEQAKTVAR